MNYTWDYLIRSLHKGVQPEQVNFIRATDCSPYMELSFHEINFSGVDYETEINAYYRDSYTSIFKHLYDPELHDGEELRAQFFDILVHLLFETDRYQGMSRREYYIRFLIRELKAGIYGNMAAKQMESFSLLEQIIVANGLLSLFRTGENMVVLRRVVRQIFTDSIIYANTREANDLFFFLRTQKTVKKQDKIDLIVTLFMPLRFRHEVYWEKIFGVQSLSAYMRQEDFVQY